MEYQQIVAKVKSLGNEVIKAEATQERIMAEIKTTFGVNTIEEAQALLEKFKVEQATMEAEVTQLTKELEGLTDWSVV
jgi:outer membrane protein assembly factor BamA